MNPFNRPKNRSKSRGGNNEPSDFEQVTDDSGYELLSDIQNMLQQTSASIGTVDNNVRIVYQGINRLFQLLEQRFNSNLQETVEAKRELEEFKRYIKEEIIKEIKVGIERGHYPHKLAIEQNNSLTNELNESLLKTKNFIEEIVQIQLRDLMNERQKLSNLHEELESWQDFSIDFFQYLERTLEILVSSDDKNASSEQLMLKILKDFEKFISARFGLERISPLKGDEVDENLHRVIDEEESADVAEGKIFACQKWGYKLNGKLYKGTRAEVTIAARNLDQSKDLDQVNEDSKEGYESLDQVCVSGQVNKVDQEGFQQLKVLEESGETYRDEIGTSKQIGENVQEAPGYSEQVDTLE